MKNKMSVIILIFICFLITYCLVSLGYNREENFKKEDYDENSYSNDMICEITSESIIKTEKITDINQYNVNNKQITNYEGSYLEKLFRQKIGETFFAYKNSLNNFSANISTYMKSMKILTESGLKQPVGNLIEKSKALDSKDVRQIEKNLPIKTTVISTEKNNGYTIKKTGFSLILNEEIKEKTTNIEFIYPQIYGLKNTETEHKINNILKYVVLDTLISSDRGYIDELQSLKAAKDGTESEGSMYYRTYFYANTISSDNTGYIYSIEGDYFSVIYSICAFDGNFTTDIWSLLTINLENGKIVNLDDYADKESIKNALAEGKYEDCDNWLNRDYSSKMQKIFLPKQFENYFYSGSDEEYDRFNSNNLFFDNDYIYIKFPFSNTSTVLSDSGFASLKIKKEDVILK